MKKHILNMFDRHQQGIYSLDFSLDGQLLISGSSDKTVWIWYMYDGSSTVLTINDQVHFDAGVCSIAISPNGQFIAARCLDTVVRIWDLATGVLVDRLRGHRHSVYSVAFMPDGKGLMSGSLDETLKYWDVSGLANGNTTSSTPSSTKKDDKSAIASSSPTLCTMNFTRHKDYVLSVAVLHDSAWVMSGSKNQGVQFWDAHIAMVQCILQGHRSSVNSIDLSLTQNVLAMGGGDWEARICEFF